MRPAAKRLLIFSQFIFFSEGVFLQHCIFPDNLKKKSCSGQDKYSKMVCILFQELFWPTYCEKKLQIGGWRSRIFNIFEIIRTVKNNWIIFQLVAGDFNQVYYIGTIKMPVGANNWDVESRNLQEQEWKLCILNQSRYKSECTHDRVHRKSIWGISPQNWKSQGLIPFKILISSLAFKLVRPNPTRFFLGSTQFWAQFLGSNRSGWPSGSKNGSNWVGLT